MFCILALFGSNATTSNITTKLTRAAIAGRSEQERAMLNELLGDWKATKDVQTRMGLTAFTIPERAIVSVTQVDEKTQKVLVQAGPRLIDWKSKFFLSDFEPIT
jgi:hypothetical protein